MDYYITHQLSAPSVTAGKLHTCLHFLQFVFSLNLIIALIIRHRAVFGFLTLVPAISRPKKPQFCVSIRLSYRTTETIFTETRTRNRFIGVMAFVL